MTKARIFPQLFLIVLSLGWYQSVLAQAVPLPALGRFQGWRENALIGTGLVTGLSGSGDSSRSTVTRQALRNVLSRLGTNVADDQISSRNVAVVIVTAVLPPSANVGDRISATVSSVGDARSLAGGTLLMTPLMGPNEKVYALAQGQVVAGGYSFESDLNRQQRNYPTSATLEGGATVEAPVDAQLLANDGTVGFLLSEPDFETANRIAQSINASFGASIAVVQNADEIRVRYEGAKPAFASFMSRLEAIQVEPGQTARVVVNERTGTVVAGGAVRLSSVVIAQGDIRVRITGQRTASQPSFISGFSNEVSSLVVTNTKLEVAQGDRDAVVSLPNTTVADLVLALTRAHVDTRGIISVLQAIKAAGALHADIIVQ